MRTPLGSLAHLPATTPSSPQPRERPEPSGRGALESLKIVCWPDPLIDALGYDPRSSYVERFWLGIVGPTATWLMRLLAESLDTAPDGFELGVEVTARRLGVAGRSGRNSPLSRAVSRCKSFELVREPEAGVLAVRRRMPPLPRRLLIRLPPPLRDLHAEWIEFQQRTEDTRELRSQSRRWALALLDVAEDRQAAEMYLHRWRVHPALAHEATEWAWALRNEAAGHLCEPSPPRPSARP